MTFQKKKKKKERGMKRLLLQPTRNCIGVEKMAVSQRVCERRQFQSEVIVQHGVKTISLRNYSLTSRATKTSVTERQRRVCVCVGGWVKRDGGGQK